MNGFIIYIAPVPNSINIQMGISFMQACLTSISFSLADSKEKHNNYGYNVGIRSKWIPHIYNLEDTE